MIKLIGLVVALLVATVAVVLVLGFVLGTRHTTAEAPEDKLPGQVRTVCFVVLIVLMLGISTGWIGGL